MNIEEIRTFCLSKKGVTEGFPFDEDTLVFKVMGKMFCLISLSNADSMNLKCDPELAIQLREQYTCVIPGFHMNKSLWNTVIIDGTVSGKILKEWIEHSYDEVVKKMPAKVKRELEALKK